MERVKFETCAAMVTMPPLGTGRPLGRFKCACCEHLLLKESFCKPGEEPKRRSSRRCLACRDRPERERYWHPPTLPPRTAPDLKRRQREERQAEVRRAMNPAPRRKPARDPLTEPKKRKRKLRFRERHRPSEREKQQQMQQQ
ncbi:hypothetical protein PHYSODRAFT_331463 [Phytophthora sojae]|uniref:Uncharacterized protein n=1 Tax=Phytophthora sojae (strain P6497) TaxID=1094619 RepID=G4ZFH8_PHYSP|nr:hypothetical protein PHYSODRAFT_331463 [Phytophthora sojae]EGZ17494.1 hypothetical protein PHYSODRAFT_331463 [Phytophthora sojae]|eukprot:XP_009526552.1 hypothetical protein PHYSODRAFT_331463 [Phytophthora sojae]